MKRKILSILTVVCVMLSLISGVALSVPEENFSTYTEVDGHDCLTVYSNQVAFTDYECDYTQYVYYDFGADYFDGDFIIDFLFTVSDLPYSTKMFPIILTNSLGNWESISNGSSSALCAGLQYDGSSSGRKIVTQQIYTGAGFGTGIYAGIGVGTTYYARFRRDESIGSYGELSFELYSDPTRETLVSESVFTIAQGAYDYRYLVICDSYGTYFTGEPDGSVANMYVYNGGGNPAITTNDDASWEYDPYSGFYVATVTANLTADGGGDCGVSFYYRNVTDGDNWSISVLSGYQSEGLVSAEVWAPQEDAGDTYEFFARCWNSFGIDTGTTYTFTLSGETETPTIQTVSYPIEYGTDNVTIYGHLVYDGGEPCDGKFYYKQTDNATWIESDVTHDLETGDLWNFTVTSVPELTEYQYKASANNSAGSVNGTVGTFKIYNAESPIITTLSVSSITHDSANLNAYVDYDGKDDDYCWATVEYRKAGTATWYNPYLVNVVTGDNITMTVNNLTPSTQYEYRARIHNWCSTYGDCESYYYGETLTFSTASVTGVPILHIYDIGYLTDYSIYVYPEVDYDGGLPVTVWIEYREQGSATWIDNSDTIVHYDVSEGEYVQQFIYNLDYGQKYEVRAVGENSNGIGYSSASSFHFVTADDTTTVEPNDFTAGLDQWLASIGLLSTGGKLLFVIIVMVIVFPLIIFCPGTYYKDWIKFTVPTACMIDALILVTAMVIGYVPVMLTVGVLIVLGFTIAAWVIRMFQGGRRGSME